MDSRSRDTLLAIEQNSKEVTYLKVGVHHLESGCGLFESGDSADYDKLGTAIGNNTHLTKLRIDNIYTSVRLTTANESFYDGIRNNSSITELFLATITYDGNDITDVAFEVLGACQEKNILTKLHINTMPLTSSAELYRCVESLRGFTNLREITYVHSELTDGQLLPMVEAIRGHGLIEKLDLDNNNIRDTGCEALATLRNVTKILLSENRITNEGMISIANSLPNNSCLRELKIYHGSNQIDLRVVADDFCRSLCNTSSINDIYSSNHTFESVISSEFISSDASGQVKLGALLNMNKSTRNKRHVAIKKILLYHPHIDMEPLFNLSLEEEDSSERDLKALPHVFSWFETAKEAIIGDKKLSTYDLECKKLSAIYQFVTTMPMLFVPASHGKGTK